MKLAIPVVESIRTRSFRTDFGETSDSHQPPRSGFLLLWVVVLAAYIGGAFINHALFVMIHECTHHLLFKKKSLNLVSAIIANLPHTLPSAISFIRYHIKHHAFQGVHELDGDLPDYWEARLINHSFFGKALWLLFFPVFQAIRTIRLKEIKPIDGWIVANWIVQISFNVVIWMIFGPKAFFFLLFYFSCFKFDFLYNFRLNSDCRDTICKIPRLCT